MSERNYAVLSLKRHVATMISDHGTKFVGAGLGFNEYDASWNKKTLRNISFSRESDETPIHPHHSLCWRMEATSEMSQETNVSGVRER